MNRLMTLLAAHLRQAALALVVIAPSLLTACSSTPGRLPQLASTAAVSYLLGPGDVLQITVFGDTDLTGPYRVSDSGTVAMPLVGQLRAQGLSVADFQKSLVERLNARAIKSPDVTVQINEYRPFFILGEVKNPGSYPYVPNMTVLTAVAIAGGFTFRASQNEVSITRAAQGEARAQRDSRLLPGDVVYVFERHF
jgi:polysaccharide export outer membrane protein